jgi:D-arabinose 1-dehydrogenase-like Zn-dependent alcohol dehydrogenase
VRAVVVRPGPPPRAIELADVAAPIQRSDDVLVRVRACGMNRSDLHLLDGRMPSAADGAVIAGSEIVGEVASRDARGRGPAPGTLVLCDSNRSCGQCRDCRAGRENRCARAEIAGVTVDGGLAELAVAPWWTLVEIPHGVEAVRAAAVALSGMTAWHMLHGRANVQMGEVALVLSAGSAVGTLAVQIARNAGARVLATTTSDKASAISALGAEAVFERDGDVRTAVLKATLGVGADVVIDHAGGESFALAVRCAARGGRVVTCGATAGSEAMIDIWKLFSKEVAILGSVGASRAETAALLAEVAAGRVVPVVSSTHKLEEFALAYAALRDMRRVGKVVVNVC